MVPRLTCTPSSASRLYGSLTDTACSEVRGFLTLRYCDTSQLIVKRIARLEFVELRVFVQRDVGRSWSGEQRGCPDAGP